MRDQSFIKRMSCQCGTVADHYKFLSRSCHSHIGPADVTEKSNLCLAVTPYKADDYNIPFLTLKCIHGINRN